MRPFGLRELGGLLAVAAVAVACGRGSSGAGGGDAAILVDAASTLAARDPVLEELWTQALGGEAGDLARLADREGAMGLAERGAADPAVRATALRAMAFAPEPGAFGGFPFLAEAARGTDEAQAEAALQSAIDLAARPRRAIDPEDAAEMKAGCDSMLALAVDPKAARARRVNAIRALRMLADRGCVDPRAIPADLDAR
ncbi:MAG: hypothetical protein ACLQBL_29220 [Polyangiaceae bacterium]